MLEKFRTRYLGDGKWDNKEFTVTNSGTVVTLYFQASGTDSSDDTNNIYKRYYNLGRGANHINIRPSAVVTITGAKMTNGVLITFSDPITVQTTGYKRDYCDLEYLILNVATASTQLKIEAS